MRGAKPVMKKWKPEDETSMTGGSSIAIQLAKESGPRLDSSRSPLRRQMTDKASLSNNMPASAISTHICVLLASGMRGSSRQSDKVKQCEKKTKCAVPPPVDFQDGAPPSEDACSSSRTAKTHSSCNGAQWSGCQRWNKKRQTGWRHD